MSSIIPFLDESETAYNQEDINRARTIVKFSRELNTFQQLNLVIFF